MRDYDDNPFPPGTMQADVDQLLTAWRSLQRTLTAAFEPLYVWAGEVTGTLSELAAHFEQAGEDARHDPIDFRRRTQAPPADPRLRGAAFRGRGAGIAAHGRARPSRPL